MAGSYSLVCLDCLVGLHLGKFVKFDEGMNPVSQRFTGFRDTVHDRWVGQPQPDDESPNLWDAAQWFLFAHGDHLMTVSDSDQVLRMYQDTDPDGSPFSYVQDPAELLAGIDQSWPGSALEELRRRVDSRIRELETGDQGS